MTRGAIQFRSSRTQNSSLPMSTDGVDLGHADQVGEGPDGLGPVAPPAHPGDRRHAGVVPARDVPVVHQGQELALAHDRVVEVQPGELVLVGPHVAVPLRDAGAVDHPVVQLAVVLELQRADRMGHALDGVPSGWAQSYIG